MRSALGNVLSSESTKWPNISGLDIQRWPMAQFTGQARSIFKIRYPKFIESLNDLLKTLAQEFLEPRSLQIDLMRHENVVRILCSTAQSIVGNDNIDLLLLADSRNQLTLFYY